jgi:hypothetical protein
VPQYTRDVRALYSHIMRTLDNAHRGVLRIYLPHYPRHHEAPPQNGDSIIFTVNLCCDGQADPMLVVFHRQSTEEAATELHASERCTRTGFLAIVGGEGFEALLYLRERILITRIVV